jgi:uncharacterized protein (UPF0261 family)
MAKRPRILVAGILDTKGAEIRYLADRVRAAGGDPSIMELTVGGDEVGWADIGVAELAGRVGTSALTSPSSSGPRLPQWSRRAAARSRSSASPPASSMG